MSGDAQWADVALLLDWEGTSGGTNATDASLNANTLSFIDGAVLDNSPVKFGGTSLECLRSTATLGSRVLVTPGSNFELTDQDWCIETHHNSGSHTGSRAIMSRGREAAGEYGWKLERTSTGIQFSYSTTGNSYDATLSGTVPVSTLTFPHYAVQRIGSTIYLYAAGTLLATATIGTASMWEPATTTTLVFCALRNAADTGYNSQIAGHIDDTRITIGSTRYPATSFTLPDGPFPVGFDTDPASGDVTASWAETAFNEDEVPVPVTAAFSEAAFEEDTETPVTASWKEVMWIPKRVRRMSGQIRHSINTSENGSLEDLVTPPPSV